MRKLAAFLVPLALAACQKEAQNAAPAPLPAQVPAAPAASAPVTPEAPPPAPTPEPEKPTPPKARPGYDADLNLVGTEPFWGVQIREGRITLQRPDHPDITVPNPGPSISGGAARWDAGELAIVLKPAECSDGMSDRTYPFEATVTVGKDVLKGCAADAESFRRNRP